MVKYILNLSNEKPKEKSLPVRGKFDAKIPSGDKGKGVFIVRASYEDQGANNLPSLKSEQSFVLRNAKVDVHSFDEYDNINKMAFSGRNLLMPAKSGSSARMKQVDLNGVTELQIFASAQKAQLNAAGGKVELRMDSANGKLIGETAFLEASDKSMFGAGPLSIPIKLPDNEANKLHDLYLVFVNPKSEGQTLMVVTSVEFKLKTE
jgi:cytochrome c